MTAPFSDDACRILEKRYLKKNPAGKVVETPGEMLRRVVRHVAGGDVLLGEDQYLKKDQEADAR
jgi:ribonucleoside-diphosphate reductase alpha chain